MRDIQNNPALITETKILIVDDDPVMARSIQSVLSLVGLEAHSVTGGYAAIKELDSRSYHLVLLDLNMPDMDGTEVLDHINTNMIDTNVIVVSGESEVKKAIHVLKNGARDFIRKPYSTDELLFSIKNVLEKINLELDNREMVEKLEESEALHRFIVHNSPDLLYMLDRDGYFVFVNKNTLKSLGYRRKEIIGKHYTEVVYPKDIERAKLFFNNGFIPQNAKNLELRLQNKKKSALLHVEIRAINIEKKITGGYKLGRNDHRKPGFIGTYGVARDITERKKSEEIIRYQYNHDLLTGLPNRTLLNERLSSLINHAQAEQSQFAVLFIDINRFKLINDTYGQSLGDELLQNLSEILRRCTREGDTLARLGGDEFILLLPDIDTKEDAIVVADKIIKETSIPFKRNGHEIYLTLSVGMAIYPEHGETGDDLIKCADIAVCNAKTKTESRHYLYNKKLKNNNSTKVFVENLIRDAIRSDRLIVHYQPQIKLPSNDIHAVEALVRILSPTGKLILPGKFIDIAEETSLINDIGDIVLDKVCRDIQSWNQQGLHIQVSINISAVQLAMEFFAQNILERIHSYGLDARTFEIELTENVLVQNMNRAISNLLQLTNAGMKIAIDDFGIGYSSLSYLDRLPLHTLKLDKSFMRKISADNMEDSIIPAMISVAKGLQLEFIAEGVETKAQHHYLKSQGPCVTQGFYYCKPLDSQRLLAFMDRHRQLK
ncbi:MAG: EAL domain-containing protein [Desulfuromonadales bacterium]|nr:EAL domain-containing protein [Desulfuromonadales bacterium]MBN2792004.1 EAL domain-containing protein [Desulfuromonadales bacterium]